jgi:hypothetical protein
VPLETAVELEHHARVDLDGDDGLDPRLEEALGEVSRTRPDLEDGVGGLEPGLGNYGIDQCGVPQDVLPLGLLKRDPILQPAAPSSGAPRRAVALLLDLSPSHGGGFSSGSPLALYHWRSRTERSDDREKEKRERGS